MSRINPDKIKDDNSRQSKPKIIKKNPAQIKTQKTKTKEATTKKNIKTNTKTQKKETEKKKVVRGRAKSNSKYFTNDGHPLTPLEAKFIDIYIEEGNQQQAVIKAGYKTNTPRQYAQTILKKDYIGNEIAYRLKKLEEKSIATAEEILQYFTKVMRGEVEDQFGLEAPLSERTKAAQELAKRKIDMVNKVNGKETATVTIQLDWGGMDDGEEDTESNGEE